MALIPGTRLGAYEATAVGEGGMGQVYWAPDTKLNRDVALKILPDALASDPDRLARFTREAQTLAGRSCETLASLKLPQTTITAAQDVPAGGFTLRTAVRVRGTWLKGAAEIARGRKARFETVQEDARVRQLDMRIRFVTPDVAIAHVTNEITGMTGSDGTTLPPQRELNVRVFTKVNARWLVTAFHSAPIGPSVAAARAR